MQAVRCPRCHLLVGPGDYGELLVASTIRHEPSKGEDGYAVPSEYLSCPGSELLGGVEDFNEEDLP